MINASYVSTELMPLLLTESDVREVLPSMRERFGLSHWECCGNSCT